MRHRLKNAVGRRLVLAGGAAAWPAGLLPAQADTGPEVRLGILQFGTVQWVGDIIRRHAAGHGERVFASRR